MNAVYVKYVMVVSLRGQPLCQRIRLITGGMTAVASFQSREFDLYRERGGGVDGGSERYVVVRRRTPGRSFKFSLYLAIERVSLETGRIHYLLSDRICLFASLVFLDAAGSYK